MTNDGIFSLYLLTVGCTVSQFRFCNNNGILIFAVAIAQFWGHTNVSPMEQSDL